MAAAIDAGGVTARDGAGPERLGQVAPLRGRARGARRPARRRRSRSPACRRRDRTPGRARRTRRGGWRTSRRRSRGTARRSRCAGRRARRRRDRATSRRPARRRGCDAATPVEHGRTSLSARGAPTMPIRSPHGVQPERGFRGRPVGQPGLGPHRAEVTVGDHLVPAAVAELVASEHPVLAPLAVVDHRLGLARPGRVDRVVHLRAPFVRREVVRGPHDRDPVLAQLPEDLLVRREIVERDPLGPVHVQEVDRVDAARRPGPAIRRASSTRRPAVRIGPYSDAS